jgi:NAD(P)-dependent dehydrogenase (short-subunit alcohol dehydrogenase family)
MWLVVRPKSYPDLNIQPQLFDAAFPSALVWPEKLDGLIYFPGTILLKPFHRLTLEEFQKDLQVNLLGAISALQSALPSLKASGNASVVLFSTIAVTQGMPMHASIASAKGAIEGLTRSLAAEWAPLN